MAKKNVNYFPHDYNARNDPKLLRLIMIHGLAGIGLYWILVEMLYEQGGSLKLDTLEVIAYLVHDNNNIIYSVVNDFGLFENDGIVFWSNSVNERLNIRNEIVQKKREAINKRWANNTKKNDSNTDVIQANNTCNTDVIQANNTCNTIKIKESKEKESKVKEIKINNKEKEYKEKEVEHAQNIKRFVPPALEDVKKYIDEKGFSVDAEAFISYYNSNGWMVGRNKMKSWQAAVVTWEKRNNGAKGGERLIDRQKNVNDIWKNRPYDPVQTLKESEELLKQRRNNNENNH